MGHQATEASPRVLKSQVCVSFLLLYHQRRKASSISLSQTKPSSKWWSTVWKTSVCCSRGPQSHYSLRELLSLSPVNILETGPRSSGVASAFLHWTVLLAFIPPSDDLLNAESHGYIDFLSFSGLTLPLWAFYVLQMSMWISGLFFCLGKFLELPLPSKTCSFSWSHFSALTIGFC